MFRFGVNMVALASRDEWKAKCRKAEDVGFDVVCAADHLGMPAPFPALVLAAEATERVRVCSFVLNTAFYNPALLARDVATTDRFTDGRLEVGVGAGYVKAQFDTAGLPWLGAGKRIDHMAATIAEMRRLYADPGYEPRPAQRPGPPLLVGGWGDRTIRLAAEHADVIAFTGAVAERAGQLSLVDAAGWAERIEFTRAALGDRADKVELNVLVQSVEVTEDRAATLDKYRRFAPEMSVEELGALPTLLVGTPRQIADQVRENREKYGLTYITVLEPSMAAFTPVMELLR